MGYKDASASFFDEITKLKHFRNHSVTSFCYDMDVKQKL